MNVKREKDENGHGIYKISAGLMHMAIISVIGGMFTFGGYMIAWAFADNGWKTKLEERQAVHAARIAVIEEKIHGGILPMAQERIEQLDRRVRNLEQQKGQR